MQKEEQKEYPENAIPDCATYVAQGGLAVVQAQPIMEADPMKKKDPHIPRGKFKDGLCDCCNQIVPSCCMGYFCPCILLGQLRQKLGHGSCFQTALIFCVVLIIGICVSNPVPQVGGAFYLIFVIMLFVCTCKVRASMIDKYDIGEGLCLDDAGSCVTSTFCNCCVLSQMARHLHVYKGRCDDCVFNGNGNVPGDDKLENPPV